MITKPTTQFLFGLSALALVAACGDDAGEGGGTPPDASNAVTYYQHVKPIIDAKCVTCHVEGGIAPFAMDTYELAKSHAGVSKVNIEAGLMPPWPPDSDCNDYHGDRSLSAEQKALVTQWVDDGTVEGDASDPAPPLVIEQQKLSRVDLEIPMDESYTPTIIPDDYRCFVIPWPEATTKFVTGFNAVPGNGEIVHHVIPFLASPDQVAAYEQLDANEAGPGYTCFGGTEGPSQAWLGGWAPGSLGSDSPAGTGIKVEPGSAVILQVHYNSLLAAPAPDLTKVQFRLDDAVEKEATIQPWANPQWLGSNAMHIPANTADTMHAFEFDATFVSGGPFKIYSAGLHMHNLGSRATLSIKRANGDTECLLNINRWDFHWQGSYGLVNPPVFESGDKLRVECHWDNTVENQPIVNGSPLPPKDTYWGEGTQDEMCLGVVYITAP